MKLAISFCTLLFVDFCLSQGWYFPGQYNLADFETTTKQPAIRASASSATRISERSKRILFRILRFLFLFFNSFWFFFFHFIILLHVLECQEYKDLVALTTHFGSLPLWQKNTGTNILKEYQCNPFVGLIVGGEKTQVGEFPHMAAVGFRTENGLNKFNCGGSLISEKFVLTVAHCYQDSDG